METWKKILIGVAIIIVVVIGFLASLGKMDSNQDIKAQNINATKNKPTPEALVEASLQRKEDSLKQLIRLKDYQCRIDSLENVLHEPCKAKTDDAAAVTPKVKTAKEKMTAKAAKTTIKQKGRKNATAKGLTKKSSFKPEVKTTTTQGRTEADTAEAVAQAKTKRQFQTTSEYETDLKSGVQYVGGTDGDFYITVSYDGFLQYVFSKKMYDDAGGTDVPELNFKGSGKKFSYDENEKVYYYTNTGIPIDEGTANGTYSWAVFIGQKDGYDAYLPHEVLKSAIITARGDLAGSISAEDVTKIGNIIPEVKAGRIQPNKITAIGDYDANKYEGWQFRTKVLYTKVQDEQ